MTSHIERINELVDRTRHKLLFTAPELQDERWEELKTLIASLLNDEEPQSPELPTPPVPLLTIHQLSPYSNVMPCCEHRPFEVPFGDGFTTTGVVTCRGREHT